MSKTQPKTINDVELTTEHSIFLSKAGASDVFIDLLTFPPEKAGVIRHSVQEEIKKYVGWGDLQPDEDPDDFRTLGGHFFRAMWIGDLFEAWIRADLNNKRLLMECFGPDTIITNGVRNGEPEDYCRRMVEDHRE